MDNLVRVEEIETVKKNLETMLITKEALGEEWIATNILSSGERIEKHVFFWLLLDSIKSNKIECWLSILKKSLIYTKFIKIVNCLKEKKSEKEFYSFLPEVEVLAYYASRNNNGIKVEYEPSIPKKANVGDIKLSFNSIQMYLEITRLFGSKEEDRIDHILRTLGSKINKFPDNPFIIILGIEESFLDEDIEPFVKEVQSEIEKNKDTLEIKGGKPHQVNYDTKAWFKFIMRKANKKGYVGGFHTPVFELKTAGRLKGKILDELDQLPENEHNIIVLDISHHFADFEDIEDALAGQLGLSINRETGEASPYRNANGVLHIREGSQIGIIIAFKEFDYEHRKKYVNSSAIVAFNDEMISII